MTYATCRDTIPAHRQAHAGQTMSNGDLERGGGLLPKSAIEITRNLTRLFALQKISSRRGVGPNDIQDRTIIRIVVSAGPIENRTAGKPRTSQQDGHPGQRPETIFP